MYLFIKSERIDTTARHHVIFKNLQNIFIKAFENLQAAFKIFIQRKLQNWLCVLPNNIMVDKLS